MKMAFRNLLLHICIVVNAGRIINGRVTEPSCSNKYEYDVKILERVLRFEQSLERFDKKVDSFDDKLEDKIRNLTYFEDKIDETFNQLGETLKGRLLERVNAKISEIVQNDVMRAFDELNGTLREELQASKHNLTNAVGTAVEKMKQERDKRGLVVFSVTKPTGSLNSNIPLFGIEIINVGGGYDKSTGKFTCPVAGVYHFFLSVATINSGSYHPDCYLRRNAANIIWVQADSDQNDVAAGAVYIHLDKGNVVDLQCEDWSRVGTSSPKSLSTTFSGCLIQAS